MTTDEDRCHIDADARVDAAATVGRGARVWAGATVGPDAWIGSGCVVGRAAHIDGGVRLGDRCKVQNGALVYAPAVLEEGVFVGPGAILTNDRYPRAITPEGEQVGKGDWSASGVVIRKGASIGAGAVVVAGVEIGEWAMVAAAALVDRPVAPYALVAGVPARPIGWVGRSGRRLEPSGDGLVDPESGERYVAVGGRLEPEL
jgi:acetyltransferase-like isoleucine patch superfamily enzyme